MSALAIKPEALPAWYALSVLLDQLDEEGRPTFCQRDPEPFTSEDHDERREAAEACATCPAVDACRRFADENDEPAHVWGGVDRTRRPYSRKGGGLATESAADCDPPEHISISPHQIVGGSDVA